MDRRQFVKGSAAAAAGVSIFGRDFWRSAFAAVEPGPGPYGALQAANADGIQLPAGFTSRVVGQTGMVVPGSAYAWHAAPDGTAAFPVPGGGWVVAVNSEVDLTGGVGAIKFNSAGTIVDAYRILNNTRRNCAGGSTPWGTWLSCEEVITGHVWECNPQAAGQGLERPLLGTFNHEAACVDPENGYVYLTEDAGDGRFYRFVPTTYGDLTAGQLQAAKVTGSSVTWVDVASTAPAPRDANTSAFSRGEGIWMGPGVVYFATTADFRIWAYTPATQQIQVFYDGNANAGFPLHWPDNLTVHRPSGDLFVCEDGDNMELCILANMNGTQHCAVFARWPSHIGISELAGAAFSPDGTRLYVSSQRGTDGVTGFTYEITGPFRTEETLVAPGSTWRYLDTGIAPNSTWILPSYDDSAWSSGAAPLGYGDPMTTTIGFGPNANAKHITTWFRRRFTATHPFIQMTLRLRRDDGAIVYVNGVEVARSNMPAGVVTPSTLASVVVSGAGETGTVDFVVNPTLFAGTDANVIAVEVHQNDPASSDLGFDLALVGMGDTGAALAPAGASQFHPVPPFRILDTREGIGAPAAKPGAGATVDLTAIGGVIPANATAVVLNLTGTQATADGYLAAFPTGAARPLAANGNLVTGQTRGNLVTVKTGTNGRVSIFTQSGTHLVADAFGYYAPPSSAAGRFSPLAPGRLLDTRNTTKLGDGDTVDVQVTGRQGVPATGVSSVVVNISATLADAAGFVTGYAKGAPRPFTSNLNIERIGQTIGNLAILPVGADGQITLYTLRATHLVVDVAGYFGDGSGAASNTGLFVPVTPTRLLDTRDPGRAKLNGGDTLGLPIAGLGSVPASAAGVLLNVTMVEVTAAGFLTLFPAGTTRQEVSSVYADLPGMIIPGLVSARVGTGGAVSIFSNAGSHVVVDLAGWYTA